MACMLCCPVRCFEWSLLLLLSLSGLSILGSREPGSREPGEQVDYFQFLGASATRAGCPFTAGNFAAVARRGFAAGPSSGHRADGCSWGREWEVW